MVAIVLFVSLGRSDGIQELTGGETARKPQPVNEFRFQLFDEYPIGFTNEGHNVARLPILLNTDGHAGGIDDDPAIINAVFLFERKATTAAAFRVIICVQ